MATIADCANRAPRPASVAVGYQAAQFEAVHRPTLGRHFTKDCYGREIIAWRAWSGHGLPGEPVREMLIEAVEARFGSVDGGPDLLEFLSDNGGTYRAHETHAVARQLGLKPIHTPVCSPQSNGMAERFAKITGPMKKLT